MDPLGIRLLNCIIGGGGGNCGGCLDRKVVHIYFGHFSVLTHLDVVCWCTSLNGKELLNGLLLSTLKVNLQWRIQGRGPGPLIFGAN